VIITGPYEVKYGCVYKGDVRIAKMDREELGATEPAISPVDRDDTVHLLAASWDLLEAAQGAQAVLGDLVRGGVCTDDELEAYEMLCAATDKATRRG
jgi:hypothetical protein